MCANALLAVGATRAPRDFSAALPKVSAQLLIDLLEGIEQDTSRFAPTVVLHVREST